jgi:hypothetical protein
MWLSRALVYLAVAYTALSTVDEQIASVPLKLFLVLPALVLWAGQIRIWRCRRDFLLRWSVLVLGVAVPVLWFGLAAILHHQHDPAQSGTLRYGVQEASRFVYVLLYFPIVAEMRRGSGWSRPAIWLLPVVALGILTWGLLVAGKVFGADYNGAITIGPFQGAIGPTVSGTFRVFLASDILLIPAFAWVFADILTRGLTRLNTLIALLLLSTTYISHTRGIWVGVCVVPLLTAFALWPFRLSSAAVRRAVAVATAVGLGAALLITADPALMSSTAHLLTGCQESSLSARIQEAPELLAGVAREPVIGSGLGATLPSGYARSTSAPWSFELEYLQLLFDVGVLGTIVIAAPLLDGFIRASRALAHPGRSRDPRLLAGLGAAAGLTITASSNPYLITSVGMLTFAIVLALVETALPQSPGRAAVPSRGSWSAYAARPVGFGSHRLPSAAPFVVIAACIAAMTLLEFTRPRQTVPAAPPPPSVTAAPGAPPQHLGPHHVCVS